MKLKIKKLHADAVLPKFATQDDAGMDLFSMEDVTVEPMERKQISTGIKAVCHINLDLKLWVG